MFSTPIPRSIFLLLLVILAIWLIFHTAVLPPTNANDQQAFSAASHPPAQINTNIFRSSPVPPLFAELRTNPNQPIKPGNPVENHATSPIANNSDLNLISSFKAIDYTQSQQGSPPNPAIMVGRDHVVVSVNSSFQVFDKDGVSLTSPTTFKTFWNGGCGTGSESMVLFFPFSTYDEQAGRYVIGVTGYDPALNNSYLCIAVSQTDSATGQWYLYNFDANPGLGNDYSLEFPRIGTGQKALYLGAVMFDPENTVFITNRVFAFEKDAMYSGISAASLSIDIGDPYFSIIPADLKGYDTGNWPADPNEPHYFMEAEFINGDEIRVFSFQDPWGTPAFNLLGTLSVSSYGLPVDQPQAGTGSNIYGFDNRLTNVALLNGRLWTTHTINCNIGGSTVNCIRWYEIDLTNGPTPALVQEGTFGSTSNFRSFPGLAVNICGDALIGYTKTSLSIFPGVFVAGRELNDTPGQLKSETELHAGEINYTSYLWGFYTGMTIDPNGKTFWYLGEYSRMQPIPRWSTWVGAFTWSGCESGPTPTPTITATSTATPNPTATPTPTPTTTQTPTPTAISTSTTTPTPTPTSTQTSTSTPTATPTASESSPFLNWIPIMVK